MYRDGSLKGQIIQLIGHEHKDMVRATNEGSVKTNADAEVLECGVGSCGVD